MAGRPNAAPADTPPVWIAEAMRGLGEQAREHAIGLPEDSPTRARMLDDAAAWLLAAGARGVKSSVVGALRAEIAAAKVLAARRARAGVA